MAVEFPSWMKDEKQKAAYQKFVEAKERYEAFVVELNMLSGERNIGNEDAKYGLAAKMTTEEIDKLKKLSEDIISSGREMQKILTTTGKGKKLASKKVRTEAEETLYRGEKNIELEIRRANRQANRELSYIENIPQGESVSYSTLHRQSTDVTIDTGEGNLEKVGGFLSDRIAIRYMNENGVLEEGFFTQDYAPEWTIEEICERAKSVAPTLTPIIDAIYSTPNAMAGLSEREYNFKPDKDGMRNTEAVPLVLDTLGIDKSLYQGKVFTQEETAALHDLGLRFSSLEIMKNVHIRAGIEPGSNINQRNTAMSDMATLLGCGKDIAKSMPMTLMVNGQPMRGSFMKKASGLGSEQILNLKLTDGKDFEVDYESLGESCANLLIMDYICANIDRHSGNIFYDLQPSADGKKMVLKGVKGIDNDLSFGNKDISEYTAVKNLPALGDINTIPKALADKVRGLNKETLASILVKSNISPSQIDSCWNRVQKLQKKIQKNPAGFIVEKYNREIFGKIAAQDFKYPDIASGSIPDTPFKHAKTAISSLSKKFHDFEKVFRAKANQFVRALENLFVSKEKELNPDDPEYQEMAKRVHSLKKKGETVPEELLNAVKAKHEAREANRKNLEKELGYNLSNNREALNKKAQKLAEKEFKDEYNEEQAIKRKEQGIKKLHNKVQIDSLATVKGQTKEIANVIKRFNKIGSDGTPEFENLLGEMKALQTILSNAEKKNAPLSDMDSNLIAEQFKDVQKAISEYIPAATGPNAAKLTSAAEAMDNLCDIAKNSRERQVNELNQLMSSAFKELTAYNMNLQMIKNDKALGENSAEYKLAQTAFEAKQVLAGVAGNLGPMENTQIDINKNAIAKLTMVEHINSLKTESPKMYGKYTSLINENPKIIDKMASVLTNGKSFDKMVNNTNTYLAIVNQPEKHIAKELDKNLKLKVFDEMALGVRDINGKMLDKHQKDLTKDEIQINNIAVEDYTKSI